MIDFNGLGRVRRLLCLGAHSDDIEIGTGGTVLRLVREAPGLDVTWCVFSGDAKRHDEASRSAAAFLDGAAHVDVKLFSNRDGFFPSNHAAIKEQFETLKSFDPDLILTHFRDDRHQDHRVVNELTWNTFRAHPIWEYEIPKWDGDLIRPNLYVPLADEIVRAKTESLMRHFGSQRSKHWFDEETFRGLMRLRGLESNARYAEGFIARKLVIGS